MTAYAFQCQDCGHLSEGSAAGDRAVPLNCQYCDVGSHLEWVDRDTRMPAKQGDPGAVPFAVIDRPNTFTVLADLPEKEQDAVLRKHANPNDTIKRYKPAGGTA